MVLLKILSESVPDRTIPWKELSTMFEAMMLWELTSSKIADLPTLMKWLPTIWEFMTPSSNHTPMTRRGLSTLGSLWL